MISIAKVISMAMAKLLVSWGHGRTYDSDIDNQLFSRFSCWKGDCIGSVHVEEVIGRHVEMRHIGVGGLPIRKRRRCYSGL